MRRKAEWPIPFSSFENASRSLQYLQAGKKFHIGKLLFMRASFQPVGNGNGNGIYIPHFLYVYILKCGLHV